jgi:FAD synthetase
MRRVVAQGTFDLLHLGHLQYLSDAKSMGDRLHVIIARSENVTHKAKPVVPDRQRRAMVEALDPVDEARLGHTDDFFVPIREIDPDVIVLGHDQHHDEERLAERLDGEGIDCDVARAPPRDPDDDEEILSTGRIIDRICDRRC